MKLATGYFPPRFHWIPEHNGKDLGYYFTIQIEENSSIIKSITDKANTSKVIYHSAVIVHVLSEEKWGLNLASTKVLPSSPTKYSYHDYFTAWFRFMLHQDSNMSHSRFIFFHKNFVDTQLPLWFSRWWTQFGTITKISPGPLVGSFKYFSNFFKTSSHGAEFPVILHFVKKYKVPWILKWKYVKEGDVLIRQWFVKWWDKFSHTKDFIDNVTQEFPATIAISLDKAPLAYPQIQTTAPQLTVKSLAFSSTKVSAKPKREKSFLDNLNRNALYALLKQQWKEEEATANFSTSEEEGSEASDANSNNPYHPFNQEFFSHDEESTPDLGED